MKPKKFISVLLLCFMTCLTVLQLAAADNPELFVHTFTDASPEVDTQTLFLPIYEAPCDIRIVGERVTWTFLYENIFRSTEKWRNFSAKADVLKLSSPPYPSDLAEAMASGYLIDFRDGDIYPGTAQVDIILADVFESEVLPQLSVFSCAKDADGRIGIRAIAENLKPKAGGVLSLTLTEAHDLLILPTENSAYAKDVFAGYTVTVDTAPGGFFGGAALVWIVFFTAVGIGLVILVAYLVTVKILKKKRKAQKQLTQKNNS